MGLYGAVPIELREARDGGGARAHTRGFAREHDAEERLRRRVPDPAATPPGALPHEPVCPVVSERLGKGFCRSADECVVLDPQAL